MAKLLYQGHGSFRLTTAPGNVIYIDPYAGNGYTKTADLILVSHEHGDHNRVELVPKGKDTIILRAIDFLSKGSYTTFDICGIKATAVPAYNKNHSPEKCVGFVIETDGLKIYFAGDTSTTDAMGGYLRELGLDYAFLPTDGIYNMNVREASECASLIGAKRTSPVHMIPGGLFSQKIADKFTCEGKLVVRPGEEIEL